MLWSFNTFVPSFISKMKIHSFITCVLLTCTKQIKRAFYQVPGEIKGRCVGLDVLSTYTLASNTGMED